MANTAEWPPKYAAADAGARCLAYLMAVVAALDVAYGPISQVGQSTSHIGIDALAWLVILSGAVATVSTIFRRWLVELVAVYILTGALLVYTAADWLVLLFIVGYPPIPAAAVAILAGAAVVVAVATGQHRWRWAAVAGSIAVIALAVPLMARNPAMVTLATSLLFSRALGLTVFKRATVAAQEMRPVDGKGL